MGYLVPDKSRAEPAEASPVHLIVVNGDFFQHSAAQFWPSLIEEVVTAYPACTLLELLAPVSRPLTRELLDPRARLEADIERYKDADIAALLKEALAELELLGGPSEVVLRLCAGDRELYRDLIPPAYVDSEIVTYLICWLLNWAGVDPARWNQDFVGGNFIADAPLCDKRYCIDFGLRRRHLSEGLHELKLELLPTVETRQLV